jgi:hypothetical protein
MGHTSTSVTYPVNTDDVSAVINVASHDVATLCMSANINRWAHNKPLNIDQLQDITDAQRTAANHGLVPTQALSGDGYTYNLAQWGYTLPTASCMKRLTDFVGYIHTSKPPLYIISSEADEAGCTVVTWDEGTTSLDNFKITAGFLCGNTGVGPVAEIGIRMDELRFGSLSNIGNATFGLLHTVSSIQAKYYLGASKKFDYGSGEGPVVNFATKKSDGTYNDIRRLLQNTAIGSYLEVLPVIDTMDFSANKTGVPTSGLFGFPVGKKLRIYHKYTAEWYLTGIVGNMSLSYITDNGSGATSARGTIYHNPASTLSDGINRDNPSDPTMRYYLITAQYNFYNNRSTAITLNINSFYMVISGNIVANPRDMVFPESISSGYKTSLSIPATTTKAVLMRFLITVKAFNDKFPYVNPSGIIPVQSTTWRLAFGNSSNLVPMKNTSGADVSETWNFGFRILS